MLLGYATWGMPELPIAVTLDHVAGLGFDGIELTVVPGYSTELSRLDAAERGRIRVLLDRHRLALPSIAVHRDLVVEDPEQWAENLAYLRDAIDLAVDLAGPEGLPVINNLAGGKSGEFDRQRARLVERLHQVLDYAARRGVILALEPHVFTILESPITTKQIIEEIGSPYLRVQFDISHFDVLGYTIEETVPVLAPLAVHTHVKDQRGRAPDHEFLIPGEGLFDYVRYLKAMRQAGYDGFITGEVSVMVQRRPDYDPLLATSMTYQTLARAFEEAGIRRAVRT
jgi:sugar phosphate isomerase/epimerase